MQAWHENQLRKGGIKSEPKDLPKKRTALGISMPDEDLPVKQHRQKLIELVANNQLVIVCGETGSGKSTQIPQFLMQDGTVTAKRKLAIAQPRRLAASSLASRVAQELNVEVGREVGYSVRFDNCSSIETILKFITNGMLIREFLMDPKLSNYGALLIDEAHERTVETDVILGLVRQLLSQRPDFKVIISSATLDSEKLASFYGGAPIYHISGRKFPVTTLYRVQGSEQESFRELVVETVFTIHTREPLDGDILVFLPGQSDIERVEDELWAQLNELGNSCAELIIIPVFANMANDQQVKIFRKTPRNCRKVVLATNIAETSLTIQGIKYVVDTGLVKQLSYSPSSAIDTLETVFISQASAEQRSGRAGRTGPGTCYRLYSKADFTTKFKPQTEPEILRSNLSQVSLLLLSLGVDNLVSFPWIDPPSADSFVGALQLLYALGAVNQEMKLTKLGRIMAEFPLDPKLSKALVSSISLECVDDLSTTAAMLGEMASLFIEPKARREQAQIVHEQLKVDHGDQLTLLSIYNLWQKSGYSKQWCRDRFLNIRSLEKAKKVKSQLLQLAKNVSPFVNGLSLYNDQRIVKHDALIVSLVSGYFLQTARLSKNNQEFVVCKMGSPVSIHPSSILWGLKPPPKFILYYELVSTSKPYVRGCLQIDPNIVRLAVPHFYYAKLSKLR